MTALGPGQGSARWFEDVDPPVAMLILERGLVIRRMRGDREPRNGKRYAVMMCVVTIGSSANESLTELRWSSLSAIRRFPRNLCCWAAG